MHKYLYGADNPVDETDPSGNDGEGDYSLDSSFDGFSIGGLGAQIEEFAETAGGNGRPSSKVFWEQYKKVNYDAYSIRPADVVKFWNFVGGGLGTWGATLDKNKNPRNSCAVRMSWALNNTGFPIPQSTGAWKNDDGNRYYTQVGNIHSFFEKWGKPDTSITTKTQADVDAFSNKKLVNGQCAVFATSSSGHTGVLKKGYKDPEVHSFAVDVWILPP